MGEICYIAGKIRGLDKDYTIDKFRATELTLRSFGYKTFNPTNNGVAWEAPRRKHIERDINVLLSCDCIYLMPDFSLSEGARVEYLLAKTMGMKIIHPLRKIPIAQVEKYLLKRFPTLKKEYIYSESKAHDKEVNYSRYIIAKCYQMRKEYTLVQIGEKMKKTHATALHYIEQYDDFICNKPAFQAIVNEMCLELLKYAL